MAKQEETVLDFVGAEPAELDEEQAEVVRYQGNQVVVAGPGSGKTRVLTEKAREVFNNGQSLVCICFTRAAAGEMASRVPMLPSTTIHSYCCQVVGWNEEWNYEGLLYRYLMSKEKVKYDWILIDEVQDLNEMEFDVVMALVGGNIFAVGDPYQSIYGFQGAMGPKVMDYLNRRGCKEVHLKNNYRSCSLVIEKMETIFRRDLISKEVKSLGTTAVLCRRNEDLFEVSREFKKSEVGHTVRLSSEFGNGREYTVGQNGHKLIVSTIHSAKGREFDKVILYDWSPNEKGEEERVYYVAVARASKEFTEVGTIKELVEVIRRVPRETPTGLSMPKPPRPIML